MAAQNVENMGDMIAVGQPMMVLNGERRLGPVILTVHLPNGEGWHGTDLAGIGKTQRREAVPWIIGDEHLPLIVRTKIGLESHSRAIDDGQIGRVIILKTV